MQPPNRPGKRPPGRNGRGDAQRTAPPPELVNPIGLEDALRDPQAFAEGMAESSATHQAVPLRPKRLPEQGRHIHIWSVKDHVPFVAVLSENQFVGLWTHYYDRRTLVCTAAEKPCVYCRITPRRWKGYIGAINPRNRVPFVLEITRHCWQTCPALQKTDGRLTRRVLKTWRAHAKKPAPMLAELLPEPYSGYLPSLHSCVPILGRVFEMEQARLCALALAYEEVDLNEPTPDEPPVVQ